MAERIVSPGVFTQERDQSFLAQGIDELGAAFVGPFAKGPAFVPTVVRGIDGLVTTFGDEYTDSYTPYAAKNYLRQAGSAVVVRVLGWANKGTKGYSTSVANIYVSGSGGKYLFATLHPNITVDRLTAITQTGGTAESFSASLAGTGSIALSQLNFTASMYQTNSAFLGSALGTSPMIPTADSNGVAYVYAAFPDAVTSAAGGTTASLEVSAETASMAVSTDFTPASTPWIKSQPIGGQTYELFKFITLGDGVAANKDIKVSITGIAPSGNPDSQYGTFTVLVRKFNDTDNSLNVLEDWPNLTLDPDSPTYIARVLGNSAPLYNAETKETIYEGEFPNRSRYIRVQMSTAVFPETAVPYGFGKLTTTVPLGSGLAVPPKFVTTRIVSGSDRQFYYGYDTTALTNQSYLAPLVGSTLVGEEFNIATSVTGNEVNGTETIGLTTRDHISFRRFTVPFQGGFDGYSPARVVRMGSTVEGNDITATNVMGYNLSSATTSGSVAYKRALDALANPDTVDFNLLVVPGVLANLHPYVTETAVNICQSRGDCFYIMDLVGLRAGINTAIEKARELDTSYAATYYPWVRVLDPSNKLIWAPPSVVIPEVYAFNDSVGAEFYAPAGLNRGGVLGATGVKVRLNQSQRDVLYEGKINPIAQFPGQGISVWGQKTLQRRASALDRVNVRRLLISVKKFIASSARFLVFEQNTEATRSRFLNLVNPYLSSIQQRSGLTAFRVVMDDTNNTPDLIDRNILVGSIYLQPTRTVEFIKLDFNILPTGATFDTV